ncbi:ribosomal protein S18 acetylase RimI-like enzyme [Paenibacillus endophyticus]|uniref:Ribosomal protein S18 acetylase RimI-like enzyme n=1 Tax=Paenibacillus endophyticus TaxID=1294268 RepID=A0A7W5GD65_9BACL|nr:GNAT family N-acetyltransferase [Paenibacillus endophyticus]MBB3155606.1 ribosomal protein S18 acetylase RimI-like enzyme [Paenibacillus endophyticus]
MNIRVLDEPDAILYQALRLNALKCNPEAFGSTYEREADFSLEIVIERLKPGGDKFVLGAFDDNGSLVGIVSFVRENSQKTAHKGNVYGMYVAPEQRGQGLGKLLMNELISRASDCEGLEHINLTVISGNDYAKKLYQSLGFKVYGLENNALKYNGEYFDECLMVLTV